MVRSLGLIQLSLYFRTPVLKIIELVYTFPIYYTVLIVLDKIDEEKL